MRFLGASLKKKQFVTLISRSRGLIIDGEHKRRGGQLASVTSFTAILL